MQLIYQETTEVSSKVLLSEGFNVTHNSNHRSNEEKAKEILLKVIIPYDEKTRKNL